MTRQKIISLQGLRAVAFLAIFISHTGLGNFGCLGAWGVSVFFILSGFLMTLSQLRKDNDPQFSVGFAWNKIRSLYPLHFVTMLLAAVYANQSGILGSQAFRFSLLFMPTSAALIWLIACGEGALSRVLENKVLVKIGDLSPYTFLIHGVAIKYCAVLFQYLNFDNRMVISIAAFALTTVTAIVWKPAYNKLLHA